jgi:hypothetical protein
MDASSLSDFNWVMARCNECNSIITKVDPECYICGRKVPGAKARPSRLNKKEAKPAPPLTPLSNLLFVASLALTLGSFLSSHKMSIWCSATISGILFLARVLSDRMAAKQQLALRPVTVPRLHY